MADVSRMVKAYVKLRDARTALKREFEEQDSALKAKMEMLDGEFLRLLETTQVESMKTEFGTIYRTEDVIPQAEDWAKFYAYVRENDAFEALEKRITKKHVKEFMEQHDGALPPGVRVFRKFVVNVRRS